jgi:hypothetical protein
VGIEWWEKAAHGMTNDEFPNDEEMTKPE